MVRLSRALRSYVPRSVRFRTLDIVQIDYLGFFCEKPRSIFRPCWDMLKEWCVLNNYALYVECITSPELYQYLIREHQFGKIQYEDNCLLWTGGVKNSGKVTFQ